MPISPRVIGVILDLALGQGPALVRAGQKDQCRGQSMRPEGRQEGEGRKCQSHERGLQRRVCRKSTSQLVEQGPVVLEQRERMGGQEVDTGPVVRELSASGQLRKEGDDSYDKRRASASRRHTHP